MGYRIDFALYGNTLRAVVSGRSSLEHAASIGREIAEQARQFAPRSLLIDLRGLFGRVGTLGSLLGVRVAPDCRVAVVDVLANDGHYALPEQSARRSGRSLRYFYDPGTALSWLAE